MLLRILFSLVGDEIVLTIFFRRYGIWIEPLLCFALQRKTRLLLAVNSAQTPIHFPFPFWGRNRSLKWTKTNSRSFVAFQNQHRTRHWCFLAQQESEARMPVPMQHRLVTQSLSTTWVAPTSGLPIRNGVSMQVPLWKRWSGTLSFLLNTQINLWLFTVESIQPHSVIAVAMLAVD